MDQCRRASFPHPRRCRRVSALQEKALVFAQMEWNNSLALRRERSVRRADVCVASVGTGIL